VKRWTLLSVLALLTLPARTLLAEFADGPLGAGCEHDEDCDAGLRCISASSHELNEQGPARGLCTASCSGSGDCEPWRNEGFPSPVCTIVEGAGFCSEFCYVGLGYLTKCHGREDMACIPSGQPSDFATAGLCLPICTSDSQCGERYCNHATGMCQDQRPLGDPLGSSCDPMASTETCAGLCDGPAGAASCTEPCVIGGPVGCGWSGKGQPLVFCELSNASVDDGGLCRQQCNCDRDCTGNNSLCEPTGASFGNIGRCKPAPSAKGHVPDCPVQAKFSACVYGELRACRGSAGCLGTATCLEDESGYSACQCVTRSDGSADGGASQAGGAAPEPSEPSPEGRPPPDAGCSFVVAESTNGAAARWSLLLLSLLTASTTRRARRGLVVLLANARIHRPAIRRAARNRPPHRL
jgi:hypothetical protein